MEKKVENMVLTIFFHQFNHENGKGKSTFVSTSRRDFLDEKRREKKI
jgi:hypothetical protein